METVLETTSGVMSPLHVEMLTDAGAADWEAFVARHPHATIFHSLRWRRVVRATCGHDDYYLVARRNGQVSGILPLMCVRSLIFGTTLISVSFGVYGGIVADDRAAAEALAERARTLAREVGAKYVELRHLHRPLEGLESSRIYSTFIADVPTELPKCLERIPRKARAEVRHAVAKGNLEWLCEGVTVEHLHSLFALNKRSLGSPIFPSSLFWHAHNEFRDSAVLHGVRLDGQIATAVLSFVWKGVVMPYYSGALPGADRHSASNFMYWKLMEWACERKLEKFDFGRSRQGTGAFSFKKHQGFEPTQLSYDYILNTAEAIPSLNPSNPRFDHVKKVFATMPLWAAKKVGSWLAKRAPF